MDQTIPIIIDDIKKHPTFQMTRCTYFSIEADEPSPGVILTLRDRQIPFYLLGLSGIISEPLTNMNIRLPFFNSPTLIDELFDLVEENPSLYIDVNDIWLPNFLFNIDLHQRGYVYRIGNKLFNHVYQFRLNKISEEYLFEVCEELKTSITFSEIETKAFTEWNKKVISFAKENFPKNPDLQLKWKEKRADE